MRTAKPKEQSLLLPKIPDQRQVYRCWQHTEQLWLNIDKEKYSTSLEKQFSTWFYIQLRVLARVCIVPHLDLKDEKTDGYYWENKKRHTVPYYSRSTLSSDEY